MTTTAITVQEAQQQLAAATAAVDQLKQTILDQGASAVTAQELGEAVHAVELAKLGIDHARKQVRAQVEAERQARLQELKAQILDQAGDVDTALDAMRQIEEGAALLIATCAGRQGLISKMTAALRSVGVPPYEPGGKSRTTADGHTNTPYTQLGDEHAGLGWTVAHMGRSDAIHVGDRRIAYINPGSLIGAALERAARTAGYGIRHLHPVIEVRSLDQAAHANPEAWLRARY